MARSLTSILRLFAVCFFALTACGGRDRTAFDPAPYESPAAAAVLRQVLTEARAAQADSKVGIIVLGDRMNDATPGFCRQFADTGISWHSGGDMTQVWVGPVARVIEKSTKLQPIQLQITSVTARQPGENTSAQEVVAAWAYEDRMVRRRYLATPGTDGKWTIQTLETLEQKPAPHL